MVFTARGTSADRARPFSDARGPPKLRESLMSRVLRVSAEAKREKVASGSRWGQAGMTEFLGSVGDFGFLRKEGLQG